MKTLNLILVTFLGCATMLVSQVTSEPYIILETEGKVEVMPPNGFSYEVTAGTAIWDDNMINVNDYSSVLIYNGKKTTRISDAGVYDLGDNIFKNEPSAAIRSFDDDFGIATSDAYYDMVMAKFNGNWDIDIRDKGNGWFAKNWDSNVSNANRMKNEGEKNSGFVDTDKKSSSNTQDTNGEKRTDAQAGDWGSKDEVKDGGWGSKNKMKDGGWGSKNKMKDGGWGSKDKMRDGGWGSSKESGTGGWTDADKNSTTDSQSNSGEKKTDTQAGDWGSKDEVKDGGWGSKNKPKDGGWGSKNSAKDGGWGSKDKIRDGGWGKRDKAKDGGWGSKNKAKDGGWGSKDKIRDGGWGIDDATTSNITPNGYYIGSKRTIRWLPHDDVSQYLFVIIEDQTDKLIYSEVSTTGSVTIDFSMAEEGKLYFWQVLADGKRSVSPFVYFKVVDEAESSNLKKCKASKYYKSSGPAIQGLMEAAALEKDEFYLEAYEIYKTLLENHPDNDLVKINYASYCLRMGKQSIARRVAEKI